MLMKVFNKGQVVIPSHIRKNLGIEIGDILDVAVDKQAKRISLRKSDELVSYKLAGSLSKYSRKKKFPTKKERRNVLAEGLMREK
jgi:AbrB family looped-hinge helix DNA binding protein